MLIPTPLARPVKCVMCAVALLMLTTGALPAADASPAEIVFVYAGPTPGAALQGALQGLQEANLQGRFLGKSFRLVQNPRADDGQLLKKAAAVFLAGDSAAISSGSTNYRTKPVFNLTADDDRLRSACLPNVLHVAPSLQMKKDAEAQWHKVHPDTTATAHAWHARFEKYSGLQLNNRFHKAHGQPMDDDAWAGWAAVKMAADSILRSQAHESQKLLEFLRRKLTFDGQKGVDMNFRADGQLRQVLLLVANDSVVGEAPVRGVADVQDLDSLGIANNCGNRTR